MYIKKVQNYKYLTPNIINYTHVNFVIKIKIYNQKYSYKIYTYSSKIIEKYKYTILNNIIIYIISIQH